VCLTVLGVLDVLAGTALCDPHVLNWTIYRCGLCLMLDVLGVLDSAGCTGRASWDRIV
jgi:hypothetical protein